MSINASFNGGFSHLKYMRGIFFYISDKHLFKKNTIAGFRFRKALFPCGETTDNTFYIEAIACRNPKRCIFSGLLLNIIKAKLPFVDAASPTNYVTELGRIYSSCVHK